MERNYNFLMEKRQETHNAEQGSVTSQGVYFFLNNLMLHT